jgi:hypothetical protein
MAARPLPEVAAPHSAPYIEELHEFLATSGVPFGSADDLALVTERLHEPGHFGDDLSSLVRSFILREGGAMPHAQLLELLALGIAGPEAVANPQPHREPIRQLLLFVATVMRHPWNVPPGQRGDREHIASPTESIARNPEPSDESVYESIHEPIHEPIYERIDEPIHEPIAPKSAAESQPEVVAGPIAPPPPAPPTPIPPPHTVPEPSPPPSAIAAALVESRLMSSRVGPARPDPILLLRTAEQPRSQLNPESEPDPGPTFDAGPDRSSPVFRNLLLTAGAAAFAAALFFVYRARSPAVEFRNLPLPAVTKAPAIRSPAAQPSAAQPQPVASTRPAPTQPAPTMRLYTGTSHPPKPSAYGEPLNSRPGHHPQRALTWTYPEPRPPAATAAPATSTPAASAHPASPAAQPTQPRAAAPTVYSPYNPGPYVPYAPSPNDNRYAPYSPSGGNAAPIVRQPPHDPDGAIVGGHSN